MFDDEKDESFTYVWDDVATEGPPSIVVARFDPDAFFGDGVLEDEDDTEEDDEALEKMDQRDGGETPSSFPPNHEKSSKQKKTKLKKQKK